MRWLDKIRMRLRSLVRLSQVERELDEEFRFHLDQLTEENIAEGAPPDEARRRALRTLGSLNLVSDFVRDLRYAVRNLSRNRGFAALAVLIMALGIGANTAVFSVVNTVILKPLSWRDPDRIVAVTSPVASGKPLVPLSLKLISIPNFQDWRDQSSSFEAMAYYMSFEASVITGSEAEYAKAARVSPGFFRVFAAEPLIGRGFSEDELKPGAGAVMISYSWWQTHYGGDRGVLGRTLGGLGKPLPIVGVMPPGFRFPDETDFWYPANTVSREPTANSRGGQNYFCVARLKPGVSLERAQAEMKAIGSRLAAQYPEADRDRTVAVTRMQDAMVGEIRPTLFLLLGAVSLVLLIACANTATLMLSRATVRSREIAVRLSLGAGRHRIIRQLVTECGLVAALAGAAGLLLAYGGSRVLVALAPANLPRLNEVAIDRRVLAYTLGISVITTFLFGLVPAIASVKVGLSDALKPGGARAGIGRGTARMRAALVVGEIALAVVLLSGAGLLIRSFVALQSVALGFHPEKVVVMTATVPASPPTVRQFFKEVMPEIAAIPGVVAAGAWNTLPGHVQSMGPYYLDRMPPNVDLASAPSTAITVASPGAFGALGIPLKAGRDFDARDTADRPAVAIVNEALIRKSPSGVNPVGRRIYCLYDTNEPMTIVGVVGDVHNRGPAEEPMPECYIPYQQHFFGGMSIMVRTAGDASTLVRTLRRVGWARSPIVSMKFTTVEQDLSESVASPRFRTLLFAMFAALAVLLAMAGVYGVMAFAVSQRSNEIGLRMALGAGKSTVLGLILRQGMMLAIAGLVPGIAISVAVTRLLTAMLFQVKPNDVSVYLGVSILSGLVTLIAAYVPARRAAAIDPASALREE